MPDVGFADYSTGTALGVGALHGVGAETPTQVLIFLAAAGAGGSGTGVLTLTAFLVGLIGANTVIAATAAYGFLRASRSFRAYAGVAVVTGVFSLVMGVLLLLGKDSLLPALLAG
jgi:high-affinity nickel-transport protein